MVERDEKAHTIQMSSPIAMKVFVIGLELIGER